MDRWQARISSEPLRDMAIKSALKVWSIGISSMLFARFIDEIIGEDFSAITAKTSSLIKVKKSN